MLALFVTAGLQVLERAAMRALLRRAGWWFAGGAAVAWILLAMTGFFLARAHMSSLSDLGRTDFGRPLLDKIGWAVVAFVSAAGHSLAGRSPSRRLIMLSRGLAVVTFGATLLVFYYATLLG